MERPSPRAPEGGHTVQTFGATKVPRGPALTRRVRLLGWLGRTFHGAVALVAAGVLLLVVGLAVVLASKAWPAITQFGWGFLVGTKWDGVHIVFGALPAVVGTLLTSGLALLLAVPIALGVAIFLSEVAPARVRGPLTYVVDLSAAVPSVVYGFWAFVVLRPWMRDSVEPGLESVTHAGYPFTGIPTGLDILTATLVLTVMILPTIAAISREALRSVPRAHRESALSLGATRWEATRMAVLGPARSGIIGAIILGLGRAVGETIAVAMIVGNIYVIPTSLISPGQTLASQIANSFNEVGPGIEQDALVELGLILLGVTLLVNVVARLLIWGLVGRASPDGSTRPRSLFRRRGHDSSARLNRIVRQSLPGASGSASLGVQPWRERAWAQLPKRITRRRVVEYLVLALTVSCLVLAVVPLASVIETAAVQGGQAVIRPSFYVSERPLPCSARPGITCPIGGIGPAIEGTLVMLGIGALIALPMGLFAGIYLSEYGRAGRNRFARVVSFLADVMTGVPTILVGVFVYVVLLQVAGNWAVSAISGGLALGVVMIPIVTRATEEALRVVPSGVREAALALGFPRHRVALRVVVGSARGAVVTGMLLALSRAAGDTASLLATAGSSTFWMQDLSHPTAAITPYIFLNYSTVATNWQEDAWGAALVLLLIMLSISLVARLVTRGRSGIEEAG